MPSNKLEVSDFDFDDIKLNLKKFLQGQTEFQDYDFEGSGFAVLLDTLAYNTHYLGFNANMLANEMYLDSADVRKNIVSLAKMLNYTPSSVRAPTASIDVTVNNATGTSLTMTKGTVFTTTVDGVSYEYITNEDNIISPVNGIYKFDNLNIYEGTLINFRYTVDSTDVDQKFKLTSSNTDTTTLKVSVQNSSSDSTTNVYTLAGGYNAVTSSSKVYFGDGVMGKKLDDGNIVILEYIVTNKKDSNSASAFTLATNIGGFSNVSITTNSASQGGAEAETKDSIRFNAPLSYAAQNRAVTTSDYETIVRSIYPNAISVSAWGGEDDETPVYGVVKIAIKAASGSTLTETTKANIVTSLKPYNVASVRPVIVDPETTSILLTSNIKYNSRVTSKSSATLKSDVVDTLNNYNTSTLQKFDGIFRFSKLSTAIDNTDTSIVSNITTLKIRKSFTPTLSSSTKYSIYFRNSLYNPHSGHSASLGGILSSTGFKVSGDTVNEHFLDDDGSGNIRSYKLVSGVRTYVNNNQGTINYSTGEITINSLNVTSISNVRGAASTVIELTVQPNSNDIVPVRNQIVELDVANSSITVEADTFLGGSAEAGVGYTTTSSY